MNSDPDASMDSQLLQLERELFSLSPADPPRHLVLRLDPQVTSPVGIGRQVVVLPKVIPFQWRRMVAPAAAAVVVVSILNHLDQPAVSPGSMADLNAPSSTSSPQSGRAAVTLTNGYVLRSEPILIRPGTWQATEQHYFIQPGLGVENRYNAAGRSTGFIPAVFH